MSLNGQQSLRHKGCSLSSLIRSFSCLDVYSLKEIGALPSSFSIYPLCASFFGLRNKKCPGVATLICRDDSYVFHRMDIRANNRALAVWSGVPLLVMGLCLPALGPVHLYDLILCWILPHV